jgi:hypothetical protein
MTGTTSACRHEIVRNRREEILNSQSAGPRYFCSRRKRCAFPLNEHPATIIKPPDTIDTREISVRRGHIRVNAPNITDNIAAASYGTHGFTKSVCQTRSISSILPFSLASKLAGHTPVPPQKKFQSRHRFNELFQPQRRCDPLLDASAQWTTHKAPKRDPDSSIHTWEHSYWSYSQCIPRSFGFSLLKRHGLAQLVVFPSRTPRRFPRKIRTFDRAMPTNHRLLGDPHAVHCRNLFSSLPKLPQQDRCFRICLLRQRQRLGLSPRSGINVFIKLTQQSAGNAFREKSPTISTIRRNRREEILFSHPRPSFRDPFVFKLRLMLSVGQRTVPRIRYDVPILIAPKKVEAVCVFPANRQPPHRSHHFAADYLPGVPGKAMPCVNRGINDRLHSSNHLWCSFHRNHSNDAGASLSTAGYPHSR